MPHVSREHESDVRWIHSAMQELIRYAGVNVLLPVTVFAALAACLQAWQRGCDVVSVFVAIGAGCMMVMASFVISPAARGVRDTKTYEDEFEEVARPLFRLVRMHHTMLLGLIPLMLAQLALLFY
jgi:hypothetical protein